MSLKEPILSTENSMEYNYKKLSDLQTRINRLNHLKEVAFWDQATNMSEKGLNARSEAIAELSQIVHELECDPKNKKIIFDLLEKKNIFPSIPIKKDIIFLPIIVDQNKNQIKMFSDNIIYNIWNSNGM